MKYLALIICLWNLALFAQPEGEIIAPLQQQNVDTEENLKTKLGVKFTMGGHSFLGTAFDNAKPLYGFGAGMYNIVDLNKSKNLKFQWEMNLTFKGSKFGKTNDTSYSKISLAYLELPVYFSIKMFNTSKNQPLHLLLGGQFAYLFRSSINKSYGKFGEVKTDLPFKKIDLAPALGIRKEIGSGMSFQLCAKFGMRNIYTDVFRERTLNPSSVTNYDYRDLTPHFKDGTHTVRNMSIELSFMF